MANPLLQQYNTATARAGASGQSATDAYLKRATAYDPYAAARTSAKAQFSSFSDLLKKNLADLRGSQVGVGRLNTGFATGDEDRLYEGAIRDLDNAVAGNALQASSLELSNNNAIGSFGQNQMQSYYDLLAGGLDRQQAGANAKRSSRDSLIGAGVDLATNLIPGSGLVKGLARFAKGLF